jgi:hypothetical protein
MYVYDIYLYMCVCMCVCVCVYVCMYTQTHTHTYIYYKHTHTHTHTHTTPVVNSSKAVTLSKISCTPLSSSAALAACLDSSRSNNCARAPMSPPERFCSSCCWEMASGIEATQCQKRPSIEEKQCQKRPSIEEKQCQKRPSIEATQPGVPAR